MCSSQLSSVPASSTFGGISLHHGLTEDEKCWGMKLQSVSTYQYFSYHWRPSMCTIGEGCKKEHLRLQVNMFEMLCITCWRMETVSVERNCISAKHYFINFNFLLDVLWLFCKFINATDRAYKVIKWWFFVNVKQFFSLPFYSYDYSKFFVKPTVNYPIHGIFQ